LQELFSEGSYNGNEPKKKTSKPVQKHLVYFEVFRFILHHYLPCVDLLQQESFQCKVTSLQQASMHPPGTINSQSAHKTPSSSLRASCNFLLLLATTSQILIPSELPSLHQLARSSKHFLIPNPAYKPPINFPPKAHSIFAP
jgi:hypothetical protein